MRKAAAAIGRAPSYLSDIENGRRVPSEDVIRDLAELLDLDPGDLLAVAGRLGEDVNEYLRNNPEAGILFRRLTEHQVDRDGIRRLINQVPNLKRDSIEADR